MGVALWHMGLVRDAERNYMKALEVLGNDTTEAILARKVTTYGNLGVMWQNAGDFARSKNYYNESLLNSDRIIATTKDPAARDEAIVNRSRTYLNLATVFHQYGDEGRARELLELVWADRSAVLEPDDPQLLAVQERMADIELSAGALEKAEELVEAYVVACERKYGRRSEEYIRACSKMGDIAMRRGNTARADSLFSISIAAGRLNADESTDVILAGTLQSRAQLEQDAGQLDAALVDLQQARSILVKVNGPTHYSVAKCDAMLAQAFFRKGDMRKATAQARSALDLLQHRVLALKANELPQSFPAPELVPEAIYWKVRAERAWAGSEMTGKAWNEDIDLAISSLARNKSAMRDEASKLLLIGARRNLFELALDLAYEEYAISGNDMDLERFINLSEADRSILLKDRLNGFAGIRFAGLPDAVIEREQELYADLDLDAGDRSTIRDLPKREKAYSDFLSLLERDHPDYFKLRYAEPHITLADIRKHLLTPERQLLGYTKTGSSLYAWVVDLDGDTIIRLEHAGISDAVKALNTAVMAREAA
ncbi:MAG: tetratricopeptide repeat protein, partial [Flavobacteriales bacterium]